MTLPTPFRHPADTLPTGVSNALPTGADALPTPCVPTPLIPPTRRKPDGEEGFADANPLLGSNFESRNGE
jgi:hypothetical protein